MAKEIEIKLTFKDKKAVEKKLVFLKASLKEKYGLHDRYYSLSGTSMANTNKLLRIREKGGKSKLTYKGECKDEKNVWTREEIEINIESGDAMHKILSGLGFKMIKENESVREVWMLDDVEVMFVDFSKPAKLKMIELEASGAEKIKAVQQKLGSLVKEAGEELFASFDKKKSYRR